MDVAVRPDLSSVLPRRFVSDTARMLGEVAKDVQGRSPHLRAETIGQMCGDLAYAGWKPMQTPRGFSIDDSQRPVLYHFPLFAAAHYSVFRHRGAFVTHPNKLRVFENLLDTRQMSLGDIDEEFHERIGQSEFKKRLKGKPLAVIATSFLKHDLGPSPVVRLSHAFVGFPADMTRAAAVCLWHTGWVRIIGDTVVDPQPMGDASVRPEAHRKIDGLRLKPSAPDDLSDGEIEIKDPSEE